MKLSDLFDTSGWEYVATGSGNNFAEAEKDFWQSTLEGLPLSIIQPEIISMRLIGRSKHGHGLYNIKFVARGDDSWTEA